MSSSIRRRLVLALFAVVITSVLAVSPSGGSASGHHRSERDPAGLAWSPCHSGFQCAVARVPLDYDRLGGTTTPLSVVRLPATDRAHREGTLFLNPGGPGNSGVNFALKAAPTISSMLEGRFDIVGWDLRGTFRSSGLRCYPSAAQRDASLPSFAFPLTRAEVAEQRQADEAFSLACARRGGPVLDHMTTGDHARDLDWLRAAVKDPRLTYYGASYGSMLGTTYANLFPGRVRAVVVDSVIDPVGWTTGGPGDARRPVYARMGSARASAHALTEFFDRCDAAAADTDVATQFAFGPSAQDRYTDLGTRLKKKPIMLPGETGPTRFGYAELEASVLPYLYETGAWTSLAQLLASLEEAGAHPSRVHDRSLVARMGHDRYDDFVEVSRAIACVDADTASSTSVYAAAGRALERRHPGIGQVWAWVDSGCASFPGSSADRYAGPWSARTANPLLVIGNRFDPALPLSNAAALSRTLPRARLLTLNGVGHGAFVVGQSTCIDTAVTQYLMHKQLPQRGRICAQDVAPFTAVPGAGRAAFRVGFG